MSFYNKKYYKNYNNLLKHRGGAEGTTAEQPAEQPAEPPPSPTEPSPPVLNQWMNSPGKLEINLTSDNINKSFSIAGTDYFWYTKNNETIDSSAWPDDGNIKLDNKPEGIEADLLGVELWITKPSEAINNETFISQIIEDLTGKTPTKSHPINNTNFFGFLYFILTSILGSSDQSKKIIKQLVHTFYNIIYFKLDSEQRITLIQNTEKTGFQSKIAKLLEADYQLYKLLTNNVLTIETRKSLFNLFIKLGYLQGLILLKRIEKQQDFTAIAVALDKKIDAINDILLSNITGTDETQNMMPQFKDPSGSKTANKYYKINNLNDKYSNKYYKYKFKYLNTL